MKIISMTFVLAFTLFMNSSLLAGIMVPVKGQITGLDDGFVEFTTSKNLFRVKRSELDSFLTKKISWKSNQIAELSIPLDMLMVKTPTQKWVPLMSVIDVK